MVCVLHYCYTPFVFIFVFCMLYLYIYIYTDGDTIEFFFSFSSKTLRNNVTVIHSVVLKSTEWKCINKLPKNGINLRKTTNLKDTHVNTAL